MKNVITKATFSERKRFIKRILFTGSVLLSTLAHAQIPSPLVPVDYARVAEIEAMLPEKPKGFGEKYQNREAWNALLKTGQYNKLIREADLLMNRPLPEITEDIYLGYFTRGDSQTAKTIITERRFHLSKLVWAECLLNTGKYLPAIEKGLNDLVDQRSWNFPSEDRKKLNYDHKQFTIALASAAYANNLAQAMYLLDDKLSPALQKKITDAIDLRVFKPVLQGIETKNKNGEFNDAISTGNHNTVTLTDITGAALIAIKSRKERAVFVYIAERYVKNGFAGYMSDGYCDEGVGYYNYGFGHYITLRECLIQATGGKIDLFDNTKIRNVAKFGVNMEIINDVFPAISDCEQNIRPSGYIMYYVNHTLGLGLKKYNQYVHIPSAKTTLTIDVMNAFPNAANQVTTKEIPETSNGIRSYFDVAGVLTVRPEMQSKLNMGATFKGGSNAEHHNHNDLGSYTIVVGKARLMGDPGLIPYTAKTFNSERYTYKTINSYGHPVPLIAGKQQRVGKLAQAKITRTNFTDKEDEMVMDVTSAYDVPELKKFERSFIYNRSNAGFIKVEDNYQFSSPQSVESAVITRAKWKQVSDHSIELSEGKEKMLVDITTSSSGFTLHSEVISEEGGAPYTRLAIRLKEPLANGRITLTYRPL